MIIDCHGHYTTEPKDLHRFRKEQTAAANAKDKSKMPARAQLKMSDDEIRESIEQNQLKLQKDRGTDLTIFSPRASGMGAITSATRACRRNSAIRASTSTRSCWSG
jgi:4-oxalmesaconate hydratase